MSSTLGNGAVVSHGALARTPAAALVARAAGVVGFAALMAVGAQVVVPVPGTGVPMTLQTLVVVLSAMSLGPFLGSASMGLYLLVGLLGAPVFAQGAGGVAAFTGQTAGFLVGFVLAQGAFELARGQARTTLGLVAGVGAAMAMVYAIGFLGLVTIGQRGIGEALIKDLAPFVLGDLIKGAIAVAAERLWLAARR